MRVLIVSQTEAMYSVIDRGYMTWVLLCQAYGRDLAEANEWCKKYSATCNVKDLTQAWELYYHVFRRISKQLPQVSQNNSHMHKSVLHVSFNNSQESV